MVGRWLYWARLGVLPQGGKFLKMLKKCVWDLNTRPPRPLRRPLSVLSLLPRHFPPTHPRQTPITQPPIHHATHQTHATTLLYLSTYLKLLLSHLLQPILPTPPQPTHYTPTLPPTHNPRHHKHAAYPQVYSTHHHSHTAHTYPSNHSTYYHFERLSD